jgi:hypothetical protein
MRKLPKSLIIVGLLLAALMVCQAEAIAMDLAMDMDCSQNPFCEFCFFPVNTTPQEQTVLPRAMGVILFPTPDPLDVDLQSLYHPPR